MADEIPTPRVVIVGGGTAGWMTAAALVTLLPHIRVQLVESDAIASVGVGEATIPPINLFNRMLGITDADLLRETGASYKLGIEFVGWRRDGEAYVHPFGAFGSPLGAIDFHQLWLRAENDPGTSPIDMYNLAAQAMKSRRCAVPAHHGGQTGSLPLFTAWHFDAVRYARFLRRRAEGCGVERIEGRVVGAKRDSATGMITCIALDDGRSLEGDLFIDCSGFRSLVLGQAMETRFLDWSEVLPNDRAAAVLSTRELPPEPFTRATARAAGWTWRIPLQHRIGNGYVFSSSHLSEQAGLDAVLTMIDGEAIDEPRILRFTAGRRASMWVDNVVAIGLSAGFLEPLESTSIHLIHQAIVQLVNLFPRNLPSPAAAATFNRAMAREFDTIRDFLILHYWANERTEPYWQERRATILPDSLRHRLALWKEQGRIERDGHEVFGEASWLAVLLGQGIHPANYAMATGMIAPDVAARHLSAIRNEIERAISCMPDHGTFLAAQRAGSHFPKA